MIAVIGTFRLPLDRQEEAAPAMRVVVEATLREAGCRAYSYARDVVDPEVFRVTEMWDNRASLAAHFAAPHMVLWVEQRQALGFHDRQIHLHEIGEGEPV